MSTFQFISVEEGEQVALWQSLQSGYVSNGDYGPADCIVP